VSGTGVVPDPQTSALPVWRQDRWRLVAACSALMAMSSGVWYTASVFFVALIREFGWDYASTASIFSLFVVLTGAWGIPVGYLVDRVGPRSVVLAGGILLPLAILGSSFARALWHLYVTHGILSSLGMAATCYVPVSYILTTRFRTQLGLAFGIASAGVGVGILAFVPLSQALIEVWGWRVAYRVIALISALVILPVGLFALSATRTAKPQEVGPPHPAIPAAPLGAGGAPHRTLAAVLSSREFWLVTATYACLNGPIGLLQTHQVAHLVERGQPAMLVAGVVGLVGLFSIPGKIGWGFLSDRVWLEWIYLAGSFCVAAACLSLVAIDATSSAWYLYAYAVLIGLGYAVGAAMNPILSSRFFAGRHFGVVLGILNAPYQGAAAVGIWVAGAVHDRTGDYRMSLLGSVASVGIAAGCVWLAGPRRAGSPPPGVGTHRPADNAQKNPVPAA
jgi:MFS family permease